MVKRIFTDEPNGYPEIGNAAREAAREGTPALGPIL